MTRYNTGFFQVVVSCPNCLQVATHHIGERWTRPDSADRVEISSPMAGVIRSDPVEPGGTFRERTCIFCGHNWNQQEGS